MVYNKEYSALLSGISAGGEDCSFLGIKKSDDLFEDYSLLKNCLNKSKQLLGCLGFLMIANLIEYIHL